MNKELKIVELGKTKINKKGAIESLNSDMKDLLE